MARFAPGKKPSSDNCWTASDVEADWPDVRAAEERLARSPTFMPIRALMTAGSTPATASVNQ